MASGAQRTAEGVNLLRQRHFRCLSGQFVLLSRVEGLGEPGSLQPGDLAREAVGVRVPYVERHGAALPGQTHSPKT